MERRCWLGFQGLRGEPLLGPWSQRWFDQRHLRTKPGTQVEPESSRWLWWVIGGKSPKPCLLYFISQNEAIFRFTFWFFFDELSPWRWNWKAFSWQHFCETICLIICILWLWEAPRRLCFSTKTCLIISAPLRFCTAEGSSSPICLGSSSNGMRTLQTSHNPSQKGNSQMNRIGARMWKNVPSVLQEWLRM